MEGGTDGRHSTLWRHTHVTCGQEEEEEEHDSMGCVPRPLSLSLSLALDSTWGRMRWDGGA